MLLYAVTSPAQAHGDSFQDGSERALNSPMFDCLSPFSFRATQGLSPGISCGRSYRTLRDGSVEDAFTGTACQATISLSLRDKSHSHSKVSH